MFKEWPGPKPQTPKPQCILGLRHIQTVPVGLGFSFGVLCFAVFEARVLDSTRRLFSGLFQRRDNWEYWSIEALLRWFRPVEDLKSGSLRNNASPDVVTVGSFRYSPYKLNNDCGKAWAAVPKPVTLPLRPKPETLHHKKHDTLPTQSLNDGREIRGTASTPACSSCVVPLWLCAAQLQLVATYGASV